MLALAIFSGKEDCVTFAVKHGAKRLQCHGNTTAGSAFIEQLTQAFLDPLKLEDWLREGASPKMLIGEIGALMSHAAVATAVKEQLSNVRAFLNRHIDRLQDPSRWPVPHFVQQLAAQEPDSTFGRASCAVKANPTMLGAIIECVNKPRVQHRLRWALNSIFGGQNSMKGRTLRLTVQALAFSPEGARLAHAVSNNVVVSDSTTGFTLSTLSCRSQVWGIAFKDNVIAAGCENGEILIFSLQHSGDWGEIQTECPLKVPAGFGGVRSITFNTAGDTIVAGCENGNIFLIDTATSRVREPRLKEHTDRVTGVVFDPKKPNILVSCSCKRNIKIWDITSGFSLLTLWLDAGTYSGVQCVTFNGTGDTIAAGCGNGNIFFIDTATSKVREPPLRGHSRAVSCLAFKPGDPNVLVTGSYDSTCKVWDILTGACLSTLKVDGNGVDCIAFYGTGDTIVAGCGNGSIFFIDTAASKFVEPSLRGHKDPVTSLCFSPCGTKIASGGGLSRYLGGNEDYSVRVWDATSGALLGSPLKIDAGNYGIQRLTFDGTGDTIVAGCSNGNLFFIDTAACQVREPPVKCGSTVWRIAIKDNMVAAGCASGEIKIFSLQQSGNWREIQPQSPLKGHEGLATGVVFDPQQPNILVSCSADGNIKIWDVTSGSCLSTLSCGKRVLHVSFSQDGQHIAATCSHDGVYIFSLNQESQIFEMRSESPVICGSPVWRTEFLNSNMLLVSCESGKTRFWNIRAQEAQAPAAGGNFTFSKGARTKQQVGRHLITAHGDLVLVHDINDVMHAKGSKDAKDSVLQVPVAFFRTKREINVVDCAGDQIAVGCKNGDVLHLRAAFLTQEAPQGADVHK